MLLLKIKHPEFEVCLSTLWQADEKGLGQLANSGALLARGEPLCSKRSKIKRSKSDQEILTWACPCLSLRVFWLDWFKEKRKGKCTASPSTEKKKEAGLWIQPGSRLMGSTPNCLPAKLAQSKRLLIRKREARSGTHIYSAQTKQHNTCGCVLRVRFSGQKGALTKTHVGPFTRHVRLLFPPTHPRGSLRFPNGCSGWPADQKPKAGLTFLMVDVRRGEKKNILAVKWGFPTKPQQAKMQHVSQEQP